MALTWVRTHDWDDQRLAYALGLPRLRPRRVLPHREQPAAPLEQIETARRICARLRGERRVPRVRPRHQPGGRHLGRHHRRGAPQAAQGLAGQAANGRLADLAHVARSCVGSATRSADRRGVGAERHREVDARPVVAAQLDRAAQLAGHQRLHDREPEAARLLEREPGRAARRRRRRRRRRARRRRVRAARGSCPRCAPSPRGNAWSTAFCMSSLSTTASGVATSPGSSPASPSTSKRRSRVGRRRRSPPRPARAAARCRRSGTTSPASRDSVSCTIAIERIRRSDSSSAACASGDCSRRPWSRSSAAIVWRLFFTRWWISRIVASFDSSIRSRRRRSVTSRSSTSTPTISSPSSSGIACTQHRRVAALDLLGDREPGADARRRPRPGRSRSRRGAAPTCTSGCRGGAASSPRSGWRSARAGRRRATITPSPTRGASSNSTSS